MQRFGNELDESRWGTGLVCLGCVNGLNPLSGFMPTSGKPHTLFEAGYKKNSHGNFTSRIKELKVRKMNSLRLYKIHEGSLDPAASKLENF